MAAPVIVNDVILDEFNFWQEYRGSNKWDQVKLQQHHQTAGIYVTQPLPEPGHPQRLAIAATVLGAAPGPAPPSTLPSPPKQLMIDQFLAKQFLDLPALPATIPVTRWRGTKILGDGGGGLVGLWEAVSGFLPTQRTKLVVKEAHKSQHDLSREADFLQQLKRNGESSHIANLIHTSQVQNDPAVPEWVGKLQRIYLEYCPMGSLWDFIKSRSLSGEYIGEYSLWLLFDCLVDSIGKLEFGVETRIDTSGDVVFLPPSGPPWDKIIHFDLKPDNILLGERDNDHTEGPVLKLSDFGASIYATEIANTLDRRVGQRNARRRGTHGYFTPEQFTERWDYASQATDPVAGKYDAKTNTWGIGAIMYNLMTLYALDSPNIQNPFILVDEDGVPSPGITYDINLDAYAEYSDDLRELVWECLFENPNHRPDFASLKSRIRRGIDETRDIHGQPPDPWMSFLPPKMHPPQQNPFANLPAGSLPAAVIQLGPHQVQAPARGGVRRRCNYRGVRRQRTKGWFVCKKRIVAAAFSAGERRCAIHQDIASWPNRY